MSSSTAPNIENLGVILNDPKQPLSVRFRALFALRNLGGAESIEWISKCFDDQSALLKHELAYCLGQMQDNRAVGKLIEVLENTDENPMVRHEAAGEALGAIGDVSSLSILLQFATDPNTDVSQTCQLAAERIKWKQQQAENKEAYKNPYRSVDPAPAPSTLVDVETLEKTLLDSSLPLWERYKAMFACRNIGNEQAIEALARALPCPSSALFRHEVAFVLGQLQSPLSIPALNQQLSLSNENPMVRHECAEALGAIGTREAELILNQYLNDKQQVVRESCQVALDLCRHEQKGDFQYATVD